MTCDLRMHQRWRAIMDVAERWNIPPNDAEAFLVGLGHLPADRTPDVIVDASEVEHG